MSDRKDCVRVVQMAMGGYRQGLLDYLEEYGSDVLFHVGDRHFSPGLRTTVRSPLVISTGENRFLFGGRLACQRHVGRVAVSQGTVVVELNPRVVSSWIIVLFRALARLPTYGWGHLYSRRGVEARSNAVRRFMQRLCTGLLVYTYSEAEAASAAFRSKRVLVAANALYRSSELNLPGTDKRSDYVVVGRLVDEKKPLLALEAFRQTLDSIPQECRLHFVGGGSLFADLRESVAGTPSLHNRVVLHGQIDERERLREIFSRCIAMLAPGYVGLNVTQALGFGVPVIYADDEPHAPEAEQLTCRNSLTFTANDPASLAQQMIQMSLERSRQFDSTEILGEIRERYTVERMASAFLELETRR